MKITVVVGGRWHAFDLARELHKAGHLHRLVTTYFKYKTRAFGIPDDKVVSLPAPLLVERGLGKLGLGRLDARLQYARHRLFGQMAARHLDGSDLVHCWSSFAEPLVPWCDKLGIPLVLERGSSHIAFQTRILTEEQRLLGLDQPITHPGVEAMELREYERAARICVPSAFVRDSFLGEGVAAGRLYLNPYGVSLDLFQPGPTKKDGFGVVYAGSLSYRKGVHYLKDGFYQANIPGTTLTLIGGSAPETPLLLAGRDERCITPGHVPQRDLVRFYQSAHVFVLASIEEGMAMVQAQALACGLPLICTENTGGEDLLALCSDSPPKPCPGGVREYPAGFVVPARDPAALAWCLRSLYEDEKLLREKSEAALVIRSKSLDWAGYAARNVALYQTLLGGQALG